MNFFNNLERIILTENPDKKILDFKNFYDDFLSNRLVFEENFLPKSQEKPSYHSFCTIVHPTRIRRPKTIQSSKSLAQIIHSIVHIEYSAIDLALDACYRFVNLPKEYYQDWLEVANEEIQHFLLLRSILTELGFRYGDFKVHQNLFNAQKATSHCISHRMGLVHRALEANGLDANPFVCQKILQSTHQIKTKILEVLEIILKDEIFHVYKGNKWWHYCKQEDEDFVKILLKYKHFAPLSKTLNQTARIQAGYSQEELLYIENIFHNS